MTKAGAGTLVLHDHKDPSSCVHGHYHLQYKHAVCAVACTLSDRSTWLCCCESVM